MTGILKVDSQRLTVHDLSDIENRSDAVDGQDVIEGLSSQTKFLPPKYFYDELGSQLFDQICELPEYYPTRTETAILKEFGGAIAQTTGPCEIVELGSGSATKTRFLLDAYQSAGHPLRYLPIDVSETALVESSKQLLLEYSALTIHGLIGTYEPALAKLPAAQLPARMICFIGSTIGNLQPHEYSAFLDRMARSLRPKDYFLLGIDLQKEVSVLESAYNDSQGITAAFNLNMLRHLNYRFDGDFDVDCFAHVACYNQESHQIEMHLESLKAQTVQLKALGLTVRFASGERLLSEISRKFDLEKTAQTLAAHHLPVVTTSTDQNRWFGLLLCQRSPDRC
ncbi:L-histidine N(alpha)-methyltransferase [soil metagenome]